MWQNFLMPSPPLTPTLPLTHQNTYTLFLSLPPSYPAFSISYNPLSGTSTPSFHSLSLPLPLFPGRPIWPSVFHKVSISTVNMWREHPLHFRMKAPYNLFYHIIFKGEMMQSWFIFWPRWYKSWPKEKNTLFSFKFNLYIRCSI